MTEISVNINPQASTVPNPVESGHSLKPSRGVFIDIAQVLDRVWYPGLLYKLKKILLSTHYLTFKSYLDNRYFRVNQDGELASYFPVAASVPQGSVFSLLYPLQSARCRYTKPSQHTPSHLCWRYMYPPSDPNRFPNPPGSHLRNPDRVKKT